MREREARERQRGFPWSEKDKQKRKNFLEANERERATLPVVTQQKGERERQARERELFVSGLQDFADTGSCLILGCPGRNKSCDHLPRH
jgi:hypothetical protein